MKKKRKNDLAKTNFKAYLMVANSNNNNDDNNDNNNDQNNEHEY